MRLLFSSKLALLVISIGWDSGERCPFLLQVALYLDARGYLRI